MEGNAYNYEKMKKLKYMIKGRNKLISLYRKSFIIVCVCIYSQKRYSYKLLG